MFANHSASSNSTRMVLTLFNAYAFVLHIVRGEQTLRESVFIRMVNIVRILLKQCSIALQKASTYSYTVRAQKDAVSALHTASQASTYRAFTSIHDPAYDRFFGKSIIISFARGTIKACITLLSGWNKTSRSIANGCYATPAHTRVQVKDVGVLFFCAAATVLVKALLLPDTTNTVSTLWGITVMLWSAVLCSSNSLLRDALYNSTLIKILKKSL